MGSMPSVPQKHPNDRKHFWDYANPHLDQPAAPVDPAFPRHVHKPQGQFLEVRTEAELEAALRAGYSLHPPSE